MVHIFITDTRRFKQVKCVKFCHKQNLKKWEGIVQYLTWKGREAKNFILKVTFRSLLSTSDGSLGVFPVCLAAASLHWLLGYTLGRSENVELLSQHPHQTFPWCGAYSKGNFVFKEWRKNWTFLLQRVCEPPSLFEFSTRLRQQKTKVMNFVLDNLITQYFCLWRSSPHPF